MGTWPQEDRQSELPPEDRIAAGLARRPFLPCSGSWIMWLRRILVRTLADQARSHRRRSRNGSRQVSLEVLLEQAGGAAQRALTDSLPSASLPAIPRERAVLLADALEQLPADYREISVLRSIEHIPFNNIASS